MKINEQHEEIESDDGGIPILTGEELKAQIEYEKKLIKKCIIIIYMTKLTKEQEDYLNDLYYKQHYFFGRDKIYERIKRDDENITKVQLMDWLKDQELHKLYTPTYKTKNIKTTILNKPNQQIDIDLIDMTKYEYDNYKYIFTSID